MRGRVRVSLYNDGGVRIRDVELGGGIALSCAHGVEFLENSILVEVKEGPYLGVEEDKVWL